MIATKTSTDPAPPRDPRRSAAERLVRLTWELLTGARDLLLELGLLTRVRARRDARAARRVASGSYPVVATILPRIPEPLAREWRTEAVHRSLSGRVMLSAAAADRPVHALIKLADTPVAIDSLERERRALMAMHADVRLRDWVDLLPQVIATGSADGTEYLVEERLVGSTLADTISEPTLAAAAASAGRLHRATAILATVGDELVERVVVEPAALLRGALAGRRGRRWTVLALDRLVDDLRTSLHGRSIILSWVHGDYWGGNILGDATGQIRGIIDWEWAHSEDLPSFDVATLILRARAQARRQHLGRVVRDVLASGDWTEAEARLLNEAVDAGAGAPLDRRTLALLCWLRHVGRTVTRCEFRYLDQGLWLHAQVDGLLHSLSQAPRR